MGGSCGLGELAMVGGQLAARARRHCDRPPAITLACCVCASPTWCCARFAKDQRPKGLRWRHTSSASSSVSQSQSTSQVVAAIPKRTAIRWLFCWDFRVGVGTQRPTSEVLSPFWPCWVPGWDIHQVGWSGESPTRLHTGGGGCRRGGE
jgi:hypothetical protein